MRTFFNTAKMAVRSERGLGRVGALVIALVAVVVGALVLLVMLLTGGDDVSASTTTAPATTTEDLTPRVEELQGLVDEIGCPDLLTEFEGRLWWVSTFDVDGNEEWTLVTADECNHWVVETVVTTVPSPPTTVHTHGPTPTTQGPCTTCGPPVSTTTTVVSTTTTEAVGFTSPPPCNTGNCSNP